MVDFIIQSEKQDNGLFGMPLQCKYLDKGPSEENELLFSAICIGIAEKYRDETFIIQLSSDTGFFVKLCKSAYKRVIYKEYELHGNTLRWLGSEPRDFKSLGRN